MKVFCTKTIAKTVFTLGKSKSAIFLQDEAAGPTLHLPFLNNYTAAANTNTIAFLFYFSSRVKLAPIQSRRLYPGASVDDIRWKTSQDNSISGEQVTFAPGYDSKSVFILIYSELHSKVTLNQWEWLYIPLKHQSLKDITYWYVAYRWRFRNMWHFKAGLSVVEITLISERRPIDLQPIRHLLILFYVYKLSFVANWKFPFPFNLWR